MLGPTGGTLARLSAADAPIPEPAMLGRLTSVLKGSDQSGAAGPAIPSGENKPARRINTEKFAGGRGTTSGPARSEKRSTGRIKTTSLRCELGEVTDLSAGGIKVHSRKKPNLQLGDKKTITLKAEDESVELETTCVWLRVDDDCQFDIGLRIENADGAKRRRLLEIAATAQATDGLSRGWSPMF